MSRRKKVIRNFIILIILSYLVGAVLGIRLTPISAHEFSERSIHYGPSEIVHIEDYEKGKFILSKYDNWVSCNTVDRALFFFWWLGKQPVGFQNDKSKSIKYTWGFADQYYKFYGIINDDKIKKVEITLSNGEILTQTKFYDSLFLLTWKSDSSEDIYSKIIRGYDANNNIILEEDRYGEKLK